MMLQYQMSNTGGQCWCSFEPCPICEIQFQDSVLKFVSDKTSKLKSLMTNEIKVYQRGVT